VTLPWSHVQWEPCSGAVEIAVGLEKFPSGNISLYEYPCFPFRYMLVYWWKTRGLRFVVTAIARPSYPHRLL